jgi:hypothetical protein
MRAIAIALVGLLSLALAVPVDVEETKIEARAIPCHPSWPGTCATTCTTSGYLRCGSSYVSTCLLTTEAKERIRLTQVSSPVVQAEQQWRNLCVHMQLKILVVDRKCLGILQQPARRSSASRAAWRRLLHGRASWVFYLPRQRNGIRCLRKDHPEILQQ